jgi:hypothetical protein
MMKLNQANITNSPTAYQMLNCLADHEPCKADYLGYLDPMSFQGKAAAAVIPNFEGMVRDLVAFIDQCHAFFVENPDAAAEMNRFLKTDPVGRDIYAKSRYGTWSPQSPRQMAEASGDPLKNTLFRDL